MTAIEMARECMKNIDDEIPRFLIGYAMKSGGKVLDAIDAYGQQLCVNMHTMQQAELDAKCADIAELVECLSQCEGVLATLAKEPDVNPWLIDVRRLLAKHRPDAFARRADGLIEGEER